MRRYLIAVLILAASPALAQAPKAAQAKPAAANKNWTPPKTPWGEPDLQGVWNDATSTPLERPDRVGAKSVLNDEEAGDFQQQLADELSRDRRDGSSRPANSRRISAAASRLKVRAGRSRTVRTSGCSASKRSSRRSTSALSRA